jgi:hypothetical protein
MVRMRVVEADDVFSPLPPLPLDANQFARIDAIAIVRRVVPGVARARNRVDNTVISIHLAEQNPAAFVRIGLFTVPAKLV